MSVLRLRFLYGDRDCGCLDLNAAQSLTVGAGRANDVVAPGVPENWFTIQTSESGSIRLTCPIVDTLVDGARIAGAQVSLFSGWRRYLPVPRVHRLVLGEATVEASLAEESARPVGSNGRRSWRFDPSRAMPGLEARHATVGLLAGLCACGLAAMWVVQPGPAPAGATPAQRGAGALDAAAARSAMTAPASHEQGSIGAGGRRQDPPTDRWNSHSLDTALRASMIRLGLQSRLVVTTTPQGAIVSGSVAQGEMPAVQGVIGRLRADGFGPLLSQLSDHAPKPTFGIRSVSLKPTFIVVDAGRRVLIGDVVKDGWSLASVSEQNITLRRGEATQQIDRH